MMEIQQARKFCSYQLGWSGHSVTLPFLRGPQEYR